MTFYVLGSGGDVINNPNLSMFPQAVYLDGRESACGHTLLRPAEHMSPSTFNIWRNLDFKETKNDSTPGLTEFTKNLLECGTPLQSDDILGVLTIPHESIVQGIYWRVECPQEDTVLEVLWGTDETVIGEIDATPAVPGEEKVICGYFPIPANRQEVGCNTNELISIRLKSWPEAEESDQDPCSVYGPCDELTLCLTLNAFIWHPVAGYFCRTDPCYGQGRGTPRITR